MPLGVVAPYKNSYGIRRKHEKRGIDRVRIDR